MGQVNPGAPQSGTSKADNRIPQLDGLRGLACVAVVMCHCYLHCGDYAWPILPVLGETWAPTRLLYFGYSGVELFFILSGFCLSWPLLGKPLPIGYWPRWFWRRFWRIAPPYYGAILVSILLAVFFHFFAFDIAGARTKQTEIPSIKSVLIACTFYGTMFNDSFWTLILEWRWYFLFPFLLILSRWLGSLVLLFVTAGLSVATFFLLPGTLGASPGNLSQLLLYLPLFGLGIVAAKLFYARRNADTFFTPLRIRILLVASVAIAFVCVPPRARGLDVLPQNPSLWPSLFLLAVVRPLRPDWEDHFLIAAVDGSRPHFL